MKTKKEDQITKLESILNSNNADEGLKESIRKRIKVLKGDKTVLK